MTDSPVSSFQVSLSLDYEVPSHRGYRFHPIALFRDDTRTTLFYFAFIYLLLIFIIILNF